MLYPDFNDLVALKDRKSKSIHPLNRLVASSSPGSRPSPFRGQGLEFDSVREYVPGDDIRSIDWRVTARTGSPHLKLFRQERERQIVVAVDVNSSMRFGTRNTFKSVQAARVAAFLGWRAIAEQDRLSAYLFGDAPNEISYFKASRTRKSFCGMLDLLSQAPKEIHNVPLFKVLQKIHENAESGMLIYVISDFLDYSKPAEIEKFLGQLSKKCELVFISINDPMDKELYDVGPLGFFQTGADKFFVDTRNKKGRDLYQEQWICNRNFIHKIINKYKISYLEMTTSSDIIQELQIQLKTLSKRKKR